MGNWVESDVSKRWINMGHAGVMMIRPAEEIEPQGDNTFDLIAVHTTTGAMSRLFTGSMEACLTRQAEIIAELNRGGA